MLLLRGGACTPLLRCCPRLAQATALVNAARCNATASQSNNNGGGNYAPRRRFSSEQEFHDNLPPCFDIVRWHEDPVKGHLLRVLYQDNCVVLTYITQEGQLTPPPPTTPPQAAGSVPRDETAIPTPAPTARLSLRGKRVLSVHLPTIYMARFLAVLEGNLDKCDIASRQATGTLVALPEPHHFRLTVTGSIPNAENPDQPKKMEWVTEMDPATALLMQRFLSQALKYNAGFTK